MSAHSHTRVYSSSADYRIYANEGIVQLLFLEGQPDEISYEARQDKYQNQLQMVTPARVWFPLND